MTTVREIYNTLFAFAPASMKMDWDNVGLLCGRFDAPEKLRYYETALAEIREMRKQHDDCS